MSPIHPTTARTAVAASNLLVKREDIRFANLTADRVRVQVTVRNTGPTRSRPTTLTLRSAAFGAHVGWKPLARVRVGSIPPGGRRNVSVDVLAPPVAPVAALTGRIRRSRLSRRRALRGGLPSASTVLEAVERPAGMGTLVGSLAEALGSPRRHWLGNIDVHVGDCRVERHGAKAPLVQGCKNVGFFCVGRGAAGYDVRLRGEAAAWNAHVLQPGWNEPFAARAGGTIHIPGAEHSRYLAFECTPPMDAERGKVEIVVERLPDRAEAVVEFELDVAVPGRGTTLV